MRKNLLLFVCAFATLSMYTTSCKKDSKSPQQLILGKWNYGTYREKEVNGTDVYEDTDDMSGLNYYLDFRSDGKVYMYMYDEYDTSSYSIPDAKTLKVDNETFVLKKLTENNLTIYARYGEADMTYEQWLDFTK